MVFYEKFISFFRRDIDISLMSKDTRIIESSFVNVFGFASIILLVFMVSYNRFLIYHSTYYPLFKLAWNRFLFPGDMIQNSFFREASILFYTLLGYMDPITRYFGEDNFLFIIYMANNLLILFVCYKTAMLFGSKNLSILFVIVLFTAYQLLPGADISIVYAHNLSPTAFAMLPALLSFYLYFSKKFLLFFLSVAITCLINLKTGFAIGVPLAFCLLRDLIDSSLNRKKLIGSILLATPLFVLIVYFFLDLSSDLKNCDDLIKAMIKREYDEVDILKTNIFTYRTYNYFFLNVVAIYLCIRYKLSSYLEKRVFWLIVGANTGLLIGVMVSIIHNHVTPVNTLMLLAWPKIGIVSTYLSILVICGYLMFHDSIWGKWHPILLGCIFFFGLEVLLNSHNLKILGSQALLSFFVYVIYYLKLAKRRNIRLLFALLFIVTSVASNLYFFQRCLKERITKQWTSTLYRVPYHFDSFSYEASQWMNNNAGTEKMIIYPIRDNGTVAFSNIRKYSEHPWFYTSRITDAYGSCLLYEEWKSL